MTESSSAGRPDGAALPADHPLGPAVPIPPLEKESERAGDTSGRGGTGGPGTAGASSGHAGPSKAAQGDGGEPRADRRENVLDPSAGSSDPEASTIRDEQGTHSAGAVPAAYNGVGSPDDPAENRHPEDAVAERDAWDGPGESGRDN